MKRPTLRRASLLVINWESWVREGWSFLMMTKALLICNESIGIYKSFHRHRLHHKAGSAWPLNLLRPFSEVQVALPSQAPRIEYLYRQIGIEADKRTRDLLDDSAHRLDGLHRTATEDCERCHRGAQTVRIHLSP